MKYQLKEMMEECHKLRTEIIEIDNYNRPNKNCIKDCVFIRLNKDLKTYFDKDKEIRVWKTFIYIGKTKINELPEDIQDIILTYAIDRMKDIKKMMYRVRSYMAGSIMQSDLLIYMDDKD